MPPRPQFTMPQRNFLAFEYHKMKGKKKFKAEILRRFRLKFPGVRDPGTHQMKRIWEKQMLKGTVNNCNSKSSPGATHSGRTRTVRTPTNAAAVKNVMMESYYLKGVFQALALYRRIQPVYRLYTGCIHAPIRKIEF